MKLVSRPLIIFTFSDDLEKLEAAKLRYMGGQCELVLKILRDRNGPWTSELLANALEDYNYQGVVPPTRVANYFMFRLKRAGVLTYYKNLGEYAAITAIRAK